MPAMPSSRNWAAKQSKGKAVKVRLRADQAMITRDIYDESSGASDEGTVGIVVQHSNFPKPYEAGSWIKPLRLTDSIFILPQDLLVYYTTGL